MNFLKDQPSQGPWTLDPNKHKSNLNPGNYWLGKYGKGNVALEVIHATFNRQPPRNDVRNAWKNHWNDRPAPVLLIATYTADGQQLASVCGPTEQKKLPVWERVPLKQAEQLAKAALNASDRDNAINLIRDALPELNSPLPGVINRGLFSTHHLVNRATDRDDWDEIVQEAHQLYGRKDKDLVQGLGFAVENLTDRASILRDKDGEQVKQAVAVFLKENEFPETTSDRFNLHSPVTYALTMADREQLPYAVVTKGSQIRLYCTDVTKGVGRKGRTETYVELNTDLLGDKSAGLLPLLFAPRALKPDGTVDTFLKESHKFASAIGKRLRDRIYHEVVPLLATSIARQQSSNSKPTAEQLESYYEQAMLVLFRILFVAYAEDRDLLPYRTNGEYKDHSLKHKAERMSVRSADAKYAHNQSTLWQEVNDLWQAVAKGNVEWGVPPYNGGLFDDDPTTRPAGAKLSSLSLSNADFGPVLEALLIDKTEHGPVDFRSLSVREFGTIYEGLLESSLGYAKINLTLINDKKKKDIYVPTPNGQNVVVKAGEFYLHNRSGQRKSSGAYFTTSFAVEHLLKEALDPALQNHLDRITKLLDDGDRASAAENFFDFRCADISMGSGHFLIAAIDYIERGMANFLNDHPICGVQTELDRLRNAAHHNLQESLGTSAQAIRIENSNLLRRQIARRCIYGVDLNPISVELARLSVWIHTFVPGLPLSFLDRTLVHGDSLTGIGTIEESLAVFQIGRGDMMAAHIKSSLEAATEPLKRLAKIPEANITEAQQVRSEYQSAVAETALVKDTMDLAIGVRAGKADRPVFIDLNELKKIRKTKGLKEAKELANELNTVHFPTAFPEVFMSERSGFDCIIGNPPWEKIKIEEHEFWARHFPGHRGLTPAKRRLNVEQYRYDRPDLVKALKYEQDLANRKRNIYKIGPFKLGGGDTDLYQIFAWRFWQLLANDGYIGVVLPRSALFGKGMTGWRRNTLKNGTVTDATLLLNSCEWIFPEVHAQYIISLTTIRKTASTQKEVSTRGPYISLMDYKSNSEKTKPRFPISQLEQWSEYLVFPMIPSAEAVRVYSKMMEHPKFNSNKHPWSARLIREFDATKRQPSNVIDPSSPTNPWPIYKGKSFNLWQEDTGTYSAWIEPHIARDYLFKKRKNAARTKKSAFYDSDSDWLEDPSTLPIERPRIAFREVTNSIDSRTTIVTLIPPYVGLAHKAPYLFANEDVLAEAFLLGIMSSIPFDWVARRIVGTNFGYFILNSLPVPLPPPDSPHKAKLQILAARLAAVDDRYADWAKQAGVTVGSVKSEDEKQDIIHRIDALVARLYGLDETDLQVIFTTFRRGYDYTERLNAVLEHFRKI